MSPINILTVEVTHVEEFETADQWEARHLRVREAVLELGGSLRRDLFDRTCQCRTCTGAGEVPYVRGLGRYVMLFLFNGDGRSRIAGKIADILNGPGSVDWTN